MDLVFWLILGIIISVLYSATKKDNSTGIFSDILLGVMGSIIGGFLLHFFSGNIQNFDLLGLLIAISSSITLIWVGRRITI